MKTNILGPIIALGVVLLCGAGIAFEAYRTKDASVTEKAYSGDPTSWITGCVTSDQTGETMFILRGNEIGLLQPGEDCIKGMERMFWEEYRRAK